jgi:hypothetical protein
MICPCCGSVVDSGVHPALERLAVSRWPPGEVVTRVLAELIANFGHWIPIPRLVHAVYCDRDDGGPFWPRQTIHSQLRRERDKIASLGLKIETRRGAGYRVVWLDEVKPWSKAA